MLKGHRRLPVLLGVLAAVLGTWLWLLETDHVARSQADMAAGQAVDLIRHGHDVLRAARPESTVELEFQHDLNDTGLIGLGWSEITTSGGNLEAKRTAADPEWGRALVSMLLENGISRGDRVAVAFSGSFPGMNLAVIAAARSLDLDLYVTASAGASNYGANRPDFTWLDMELALLDAGWPPEYLSRSVTMGGGRDMASNLSAEGRLLILAAIQRRGEPHLQAPTLQEMVRLRLEAVEAAFGGDPQLYINVGGASASVGYCPDWVDWEYGRIRNVPACNGGTPGVMEIMFDRGVPVIHLLNIRSLAARMGIPLDRRFAN